jgi:hypothetical protein
LRIVSGLEDVADIRELFGVNVKENNAAGGRGAGNKDLAGLGTHRPTVWRRKRGFAS